MSLQEVHARQPRQLLRPFVGLDNYARASWPTRRSARCSSTRWCSWSSTSSARCRSAALVAVCFFAETFPARISCAACCWRLDAARAWWSARCGNGCSPSQYGVVNYVLVEPRHLTGGAGALAVRSRDGDDGAEHRAHLVHHAVQHDPDRGGADRDPARAVRGGGARRRRAGRALPLHHPAGARGRRCSRSPAW